MSLLRFKAVEEACDRKPVKVTAPTESTEKYYAKAVFNREKMYEYLPKQTYDRLVYAIDNKQPISRELADSIADGMKRWATDNGAHHYTHWFHPLTGGTAEKHDSFIEHDGKGGVVEEFSGKLLVQQEPDASSFPNGGIRNTFEARGYSAWDISSPVFIVNETLCIPTIFISYTGESLDFKTPLLRALNAVDKAATAVAQYFDKDVRHVMSYLGWEQEYFLVDKALYDARPDLVMTGRTLMGHESAKNQQLEDHYFGAIPSRVQAFMLDLEIECHKLGIPARTRHNEVAPNQFELAPIFEETNLANDHNLLLMTVMDDVARRHNFRVLLHEKPFAGINGSGKHNNFSLATDTGKNLFRPGDTPRQNAQFLVFLAAFIKGIDEYQDFLRCTVASAGNDHRLGAHEAPPAIISIFLGDELTAVVESIINGTNYTDPEKSLMRVGIDVLPPIPKDTTDRNRTSPLAFTGNKFEFRMLGSSQSVSGPNIALNTIMAEELGKFADELEQAEDFDTALHDLVCRAFTEHQRIIFNGNGYSQEWEDEAARRGLSNFRSTAEALPNYINQKNIDLVTKRGIFSESEFRARYEIHTETYCKIMRIEAQTCADVAMRQILPAVSSYAGDLCQRITHKEKLCIPCKAETALAGKLSAGIDALYAACEQLKMDIASVPSDAVNAAAYYHNVIAKDMHAVRAGADALELITDNSYWPFPTYSDILFY